MNSEISRKTNEDLFILENKNKLSILIQNHYFVKSFDLINLIIEK